MSEWVYSLREHQTEAYKGLKRFNIMLAHRRFGKTVFAIMVALRKALECKHKYPQVHYFAPTYSQAKRVAWQYCKHYTENTGTTYNESELKLTLPTGAIMQLGSADNPDSNRGIYSDFSILDEPAQMPSRMWTEVLRPALSDRLGGALFIGTPKGRHGLLFDIWSDTNHHWAKLRYKASETKILADAELQDAMRSMSIAEYNQEYETSFDAAIKGAYFGAEMERIEAKQITSVPHEPKLLVNPILDLGINDATAIWFVQIHGMEYRFINYVEYTNTGLPDIVKDVKAKNPEYNLGKWVLPHDVQVRSLSTGLTRADTLRGLGVDIVQAPNLHKTDQIEEGRATLSRCWFDADKCKHGIEALRQYRSDWDEKKGVLRLTPVHDWCSHAADSFMYFCVTPDSQITGQWSGKLDYSEMNRAVL